MSPQYSLHTMKISQENIAQIYFQQPSVAVDELREQAPVCYDNQL